MSKNEKKHKCPCCDGKGTFYLEGNIYQNGGVVPCLICDQTGWLTDEEQADLYELRKEYNEYIQGEPPRSGILQQKAKKRLTRWLRKVEKVQ